MPRHKRRPSGAQRAAAKRNKMRYHVPEIPEDVQARLIREMNIELNVETEGMTVTKVPKPKQPKTTQKRIPRAKYAAYRRAVGRKRKRGRRPAAKKLPAKPKYQMHEVVAVARRGQPSVTIKVPKMVETSDMGGQVSSSWIAEIYWYHDAQMAYMVLLNGYEYEVFIPFSIMEKWYWAVSKGTFFNGNIKGKFRVIRIK